MDRTLLESSVGFYMYPNDPATPHLGIYVIETHVHVHQRRTRMFIEALLGFPKLDYSDI